MAVQQRQALVILGMHRSGTSALAGTAVRLGLTPPRTPLAASADNPNGFYEAVSVVMLNHQILRARHCAWNVCMTFQHEQLEGCVPPEEQQFMLRKLLEDFGETSPFVLKDPRLCLTLPIWFPALQAAGAQPRILLMLRHPAEVVQSLAARGGFAEADSAPHWLHHMLEAERITRGMPRAVVFYDQLILDWRHSLAQATRQANILWPRPISDAAPDIDAFLSAELRHHKVAQETALIGLPPVDSMIDSAWKAFRYLAQDPADDIAQASLDYVRERFADWRHRNFSENYRAIIPNATLPQ